MDTRLSYAFREGAGDPPFWEDEHPGEEEPMCPETQRPYAPYPDSDTSFSRSVYSEEFEEGLNTVNPDLLNRDTSRHLSSDASAPTTCEAWATSGLQSSHHEPMLSDESSMRTVSEHSDDEMYPLPPDTSGGDSSPTEAREEVRRPTHSLSAPAENTTPEAQRRQRIRLRCNWKGCKYRATSQSEYAEHMEEHKKCPKEDCRWAKAKEEKDRNRHVWNHHEKWAKSTGYPPIAGQCDECGKWYERKDYVARHKKEKHRGKKRIRKAGG